MKTLFYVLLTFTLLIGFYSVINYLTSKKIEDMLERCDSIRLGMTKSEATEILGEPVWTGVRNVKDYEYEKCRFDIPPGSSTDLSCYFDEKYKFVLKIVCIEERNIGFDIDYLSTIGFDSLSTIHKNLFSISLGMDSASVLSLLGSDFISSEFNDSIVWSYPNKWLGFQIPTINFKKDSMIVIDLDIGLEEFSEKYVTTVTTGFEN